MTLEEAREMLGCSRQRVYVLRKTGQIVLTQESIEEYKRNKKNGRPIKQFDLDIQKEIEELVKREIERVL